MLTVQMVEGCCPDVSIAANAAVLDHVNNLHFCIVCCLKSRKLFTVWCPLCEFTKFALLYLAVSEAT